MCGLLRSTFEREEGAGVKNGDEYTLYGLATECTLGREVRIDAYRRCRADEVPLDYEAYENPVVNELPVAA